MTIRERLHRLDWRALEASLWERGYARTPPVLSEDECRSLIAVYANEGHTAEVVSVAANIGTRVRSHDAAAGEVVRVLEADETGL